jgi:thymidylate synthase (FAD)
MFEIIKPSFEIINPPSETDLIKKIELAARNCYKSEGLISEDDSSARRIVKRLIKEDHLSCLEHGSLMIRFIGSRVMLNQLTRHRAGIVFHQESLRYVNLNKKGLYQYIPSKALLSKESVRMKLYSFLDIATDLYTSFIEEGVNPEDARDVLPLCVKSDVVFTVNIRELRYILKLRTTEHAQLQIRELCKDLFFVLQERYPSLFSDLLDENIEEKMGYSRPKS